MHSENRTDKKTRSFHPKTMVHTGTILAFAFVCLLLSLQPALGHPPTERTRTSTAIRTTTRTTTRTSTNAPEMETSAPASGLHADADHQCAERQLQDEGLMKIIGKMEAIVSTMQNVSFDLFGVSKLVSFLIFNVIHMPACMSMRDHAISFLWCAAERPEAISWNISWKPER